MEPAIDRRGEAAPVETENAADIAVKASGVPRGSETSAPRQEAERFTSAVETFVSRVEDIFKLNSHGTREGDDASQTHGYTVESQVDVRKEDQRPEHPVLRHLPSETFDAAADGLEAADMLLTDYVRKATSEPVPQDHVFGVEEIVEPAANVQKVTLARASTTPGEAPALGEPPSEASTTSTEEPSSGLSSSSSVKQSAESPPAEPSPPLPTVPESQGEDRVVDTGTVPFSDKISTSLEKVVGFVPSSVDEDDAKLRLATLRTQPSQQFDYVAEGIDAADALFEEIPEKSELVEQEPDIHGEEMKAFLHLTSTPQANEILLKALAPSASKDSATPVAPGPEQLPPRTVTTHVSSVPPDLDNRDDSDIVESEGEEEEDDREGAMAPPRSLAPNKWMTFLKDFTYQTDSRKGKLVLRDRAFYQTSNRMNIECMVEPDDSDSWWGYRKLLALDWFDTFLTYGTGYILAILVAIYTIHLLVFAGFYYAISIHCKSSQQMTFAQAFAFSLETATTVSLFVGVGSAAAKRRED